MTKNEILKEYLHYAIIAEEYLNMLDDKKLETAYALEIGRNLELYNKELTKLENAHPWIANVLVAMEGT